MLLSPLESTESSTEQLTATEDCASELMVAYRVMISSRLRVWLCCPACLVACTEIELSVELTENFISQLLGSARAGSWLLENMTPSPAEHRIAMAETAVVVVMEETRIGTRSSRYKLYDGRYTRIRDGLFCSSLPSPELDSVQTSSIDGCGFSVTVSRSCLGVWFSKK